jgi:hypothetical protein
VEVGAGGAGCGERGALKKHPERPRTCTESIQKAPTHLVFYFFLFFFDFRPATGFLFVLSFVNFCCLFYVLCLIAFPGASQQASGVQKRQKAKKTVEKKSMSFPPWFFIAFLDVSLHAAWEVKKHQKLFTKKPQKITQKSTRPPTWATSPPPFSAPWWGANWDRHPPRPKAGQASTRAKDVF